MGPLGISAFRYTCFNHHSSRYTPLARGHLLPSSNGRIFLGRLAAKALGNRGWVCFLGGSRRLSADLGPHGHLPTCSRRTHQQHRQQADSNNRTATTVGYQSDHISADEPHITCRRWHQIIIALILRWAWAALISGTPCRHVGGFRRPRSGRFLFLSFSFWSRQRMGLGGLRKRHGMVGKKN